MLAQSPAVSIPASRPNVTPAATTRRGLLGALAALIERTAKLDAERQTDGYWTSIARGL